MIRKISLLVSLFFLNGFVYIYSDELVYLGESRVVIYNPENKTIKIIFSSVGVVWDSTYQITANYQGDSITTNNTDDILSFDHIFDSWNRLTGRLIGYGKYSIKIYENGDEKINVFFDFTDCNYNIGYGKADIQFNYFEVGDSLLEFSPTSQTYRIYNNHVTNIWDQITIPQGSPNKNGFQPTNPSGLQVVNSNGNPQLQWTGSEPSVAKYQVYRNNVLVHTTASGITTWKDANIAWRTSGPECTYKVRGLSGDGSKTSSGYSNSVTIFGISLEKKSGDSLIADREHFNDFLEIFPNPFNPKTTVRYMISEPGNVTITIFDVLGKEVGTLVNGWKDKGKFQETLNGTNMPSGIYFCRINIGRTMMTQKLVIQK